MSRATMTAAAATLPRSPLDATQLAGTDEFEYEIGWDEFERDVDWTESLLGGRQAFSRGMLYSSPVRTAKARGSARSRMHCVASV